MYVKSYVRHPVVVTGDIELVTSVDSGERAERLTTKELENFIQVGANAAEFIKIMPGFAINNGTSNIASYTGQTIGINGNGDGGQSPLNNAYSYHGLPTNSLDITADGAHVSDPGCNCATPVNPNSNMISEFKISLSNFSAENQKGPGVVSSVAKGGGKDYHGSAFITARNAVLNANDWLSNYSRVARPENKYYYPGFTLGGPVKLPFTDFNKKRDKLFFFTGFQYFRQVLDTGLLRATSISRASEWRIFNAAYTYTFGSVARNKLAGGLLNSWQIPGITPLQSGVNLTGQRGQTFSLAPNGFKIPGTTYNVSATSLLRTPVANDTVQNSCL